MLTNRVVSFFRSFGSKKYLVAVECWQDGVINHTAPSFQQALQWASCYPVGTIVNIHRYTRFGGRKLVAQRCTY